MLKLIESESKENQHIIVISEGSCDIEDWSNACIKKRVYKKRKQLFVIVFHNITILMYFLSNKCSLGEHNMVMYLEHRQIRSCWSN